MNACAQADWPTRCATWSSIMPATDSPEAGDRARPDLVRCDLMVN